VAGLLVHQAQVETAPPHPAAPATTVFKWAAQQMLLAPQGRI
jgi:hypothetical protein